MKQIITLFSCLFFSFAAFAQDLSKYEKGYFVDGGDTLKYRILYPEKYDKNKQYPVVLFLHGRGESGNDNQKQLANGGKLFLSQEFRGKFPAIVIFPQCSANSYWANVNIDSVNTKRFFTFQKDGKPTKAMDLLLKFVDGIGKSSFVNHSRVYVGGLSMGGMGTLEILRRRPNTFAAAFAICGGDNVENAKKYRNIPLWLFHGGLDDVVTPQFSFSVYRELKKMGYAPKFTVYLKDNHNSWDSAFAEPELIPWLFSNIKK